MLDILLGPTCASPPWLPSLLTVPPTTQDLIGKSGRCPPCPWALYLASHQPVPSLQYMGSASCVSPWLRTLGRDTCHGPFHSLHSILNDCCTCKSGHLTPFSKPPCVCTNPACRRPRGPVPLGYLLQAYGPKHLALLCPLHPVCPSPWGAPSLPPCLPALWTGCASGCASGIRSALSPKA